MQQKIVITGGPGTGKSTVIEELGERKFRCMKEISREVTLNARNSGVDQLFLTKPLLFSELLLEGRINQYLEAERQNHPVVFFDRGIPDVHAYMNYMGVDYPDIYINKSKQYIYDKILLMPPWEEIYTSDEGRYENFEQSLAIYNHLKNAYLELDYEITEIPFGPIDVRVDFILNAIK